MPEFVAPGVYVEEVPSHAHPIEGVKTSSQCDPCAGQLERPHFFSGQLLTDRDFRSEQDYHREKRRRHNRLLHGWGVVCGLQVSADPSPDQPWRVRIGAGLALAPTGDEVCVPAPVCIDLAAHRPSRARHVFVGVRYAEYPPLPAPGSDATADAPPSGRIQEAVSVGCLADLPDSHRPIVACPSLCDVIEQAGTVPCPPCAADPWVVLAQVHLQASAHVPVSPRSIDHRSVRRLAVGTAWLQAQVIDCCCTAELRSGSLWADTATLLRRWTHSLFGGRATA